MIVYTLCCQAGHRFEGWFRSADDCARQQEAGLLTCPECGSHEIEKRPSAPHVARGRSRGRSEAPRAGKGGAGAKRPLGDPHPPRTHAAGVEERMREALMRLRREVEARCEYVGRRFPEEARRIHYGESEKRAIYGEATLEESRALTEEGIDIIPLPHIRKTDA